MLTSPTLTPEEFSKLHNAKCKLIAFATTIDGVLREDLHSQLVQAIAEIDTALAPSYTAEEAVETHRDEHYSDIAEELGAISTWSVSEVENLNEPHPYGNVTQLAYRGMGRPVHVEIKGPTWKDLYRAADKAIRLSCDTHHIFIEGFSPSNPGELKLSTGS